MLIGQEQKWQRNGVYYHYYEYPGPHAVKRHYAIMTKTYKLIHFYHDVNEWELYDLRQDPQELHNLYHQADYQKVVEQLKRELTQLRIKYRDSAELAEALIHKTERRGKHKANKASSAH
ncbi:DUF4976 domain-containing protein [Paraglaciecola aquimarina]|uniref:DUF4976 domain-containing protein n=1 Tax=Paraglaciecola aquimarina TaxID=1235557 RepID=A0ABU3SXK5_9ALTE|nr:sulfatase/phosphatase domain-containing protein [Paraglaciecola aquimarina]MDU0354750.1 DUF4976 domain-containing protein [Paraglaciecola aquimarina]